MLRQEREEYQPGRYDRTPRYRRRLREGYRLYDTAQRSWLRSREWTEGLGWVEFWTFDAADALRLPGARAARAMLERLHNGRHGAIVVINRRGEIL